MVFKIKLTTSMVTLSTSHAPGEIIKCENDQAWHMINDQLGTLVGRKKPLKPHSIIEAEENEKKRIKKQNKVEPGVLKQSELADREIKLIEREDALLLREQALEEKVLSLNEDARAK